ncbi:MAG: hypothetical protein ACJ789_14005 [Thermomicrobiales bacterium]
MDENASTRGDTFVWRQGSSEVVLSRESDGWSVIFASTGKLAGPRHVIYEAKHKEAKYAAWDVMARVVRASSDEEQGLRVARSAARWMRDTGTGSDYDD